MWSPWSVGPTFWSCQWWGMGCPARAPRRLWALYVGPCALGPWPIPGVGICRLWAQWGTFFPHLWVVVLMVGLWSRWDESRGLHLFHATKPPPFFVWAPLCLSKPWTPPPLYLLSAPAFYFIFLIKYKFCFLSLTLTLLCKGTPFPSNNFAFSKSNTMNIPEKFLLTKILFVMRL